VDEFGEDFDGEIKENAEGDHENYTTIISRTASFEG
jgi:hypothetical protein